MSAQPSTWSQDLARGLSHPASVAGRQARIAVAHAVANEREAEFEQALTLLLGSVRTDGHVVQVLHCLSSALKPMAGSELADTQGRLDELADQIQFRNSGSNA